MLSVQLEATILAEADRAAAIRDHQAIARDRRAREARRTGLGWLTERREHADAERALGQVERRRHLLLK